MKHFFSVMMIALALVAALVVGIVAMAESTEAEIPEVPSVEETLPEQEAQEPANGTATDNTALQEAFDAYRAARQSGQQAELEAELESYVASGKLTQQQADLILNYYKEQEALRSGTCPNCGYQFQNGFGKGGRGNGGRGNGGRGMGGRGMGGRMSGGMEMPGQQPLPQQDTDGQTNGTAFGFGAETMPYISGTEGV